MPMLDIEKRHADVFRIRIGDKDEKGQPRKLTDSIRITSQNHSVVDAFAAVFGGEPRRWDEEWEVYVPGNSLPVMVLPGQSISQWWEFFKGSVCERRCDGYNEVKSGTACVCPRDIEERLADKKKWCQPMTRINVVCPDVEVVGAGSLVTHSMVAAETLPQSVAIAEAALSHGLMVPAMLRVVEHVGKGRRYIVPQLEIVGVSLSQLQTGEIPRAAISARADIDATPASDDPEMFDARRRRANAELSKLRLAAGVKGHDPAVGCCARHDAIAAATDGATRSTSALSSEQVASIAEFVAKRLADRVDVDDFGPRVSKAHRDRLTERVKALAPNWQQAFNDERKQKLIPSLNADDFSAADAEAYDLLLSDIERTAEATQPPLDAT